MKWVFGVNINNIEGSTGIIDIESHKLLCLCTEEQAKIILSYISDQTQPGVFAVTTDYGIKYHPTDLSNVMKQDEALFIGTGYECACFIRDHKPPQPSGGKSAEDVTHPGHR